MIGVQLVHNWFSCCRRALVWRAAELCDVHELRRCMGGVWVFVWGTLWVGEGGACAVASVQRKGEKPACKMGCVGHRSGGFHNHVQLVVVGWNNEKQSDGCGWASPQRDGGGWA